MRRTLAFSAQRAGRKMKWSAEVTQLPQLPQRSPPEAE